MRKGAKGRFEHEVLVLQAASYSSDTGLRYLRELQVFQQQGPTNGPSLGVAWRTIRIHLGRLTNLRLMNLSTLQRRRPFELSL